MVYLCWSEENSVDSIFSFFLFMQGLNLGTQACGQGPYPLSHVFGPYYIFNRRQCTSGVNCFNYLVCRTIMLADNEDSAVSLKGKCCQQCLKGVNHK